MIALPGQTPHSPVITLAPLLVIVVAATTPKVAASPMVIAAARSSMDGRAMPMTFCPAITRVRAARLPRFNMMSLLLMDFARCRG